MTETQREAFLALIRRLEWSAEKKRDEVSSSCCPICRGGYRNHNDDCELYALIGVLNAPS